LKLLLIACRVLWRELSFFASQSPHEIEYCFLSQGLHITPDKLREEVQHAVDKGQAKGYDAIILGYGLCSNGIEGVEARDVKLVVPRAHDCITFLLGSRERHEEFTEDRPGLYWYSPGWIETGTQPSRERAQMTRAFYRKQYGLDNADYLMETLETWMTSYHTAAYIDLGVGDREHFLNYTSQCAEEMGWEQEEVEGDPSLARDLVNGDWSSDRYIVVSPGQVVKKTFDSDIIEAGDKDKLDG